MWRDGQIQMHGPFFFFSAAVYQICLNEIYIVHILDQFALLVVILLFSA